MDSLRGSRHTLSANIVHICLLGFLVLAGCAPKGTDSLLGERAAQLGHSAVSCRQNANARFAQDNERQLDWYARHGGMIPAPIDRARFIQGTNGRAVVLIHGFLSSPDRMSEIAEPLIRAGYTVYMPLLTGFSAGPDAANASSAVEWRESVKNAIETVKLCHSEVSIVAHSLGAAVTVDELMNRDLEGVSHLVLLAPYFRTYGSWLNVLSAIVHSRTDVLDLDVIRRTIGGDPYTYLPIERPRAGEPEPFLPIVALERVLSLQYDFKRFTSEKLSVPVLAALSASDLVIDSEFASQFLNENFENVNLISYDDPAQKVGHSLQVQANNPRFDQLTKAIEAELAGPVAKAIPARE